jgi:hypothetical protein
VHNTLQILPSTLDRERWMYEIRNRYKWMLFMGGERVLLYKRKWTGKRCPNWDRVRQQHSQLDVCPICFGTGFVGGYLKPIEVFVGLPAPTTQQIEIETGPGMKNIYRPTWWTLWEPPLVNKDFFVRYNGQRFWIVNKSETRWKRFVLRQIFDSDLVEPTHIIYSVPF